MKFVLVLGKFVSQVRPMLNATRNVTRVHTLAVQLKHAYLAAFIDISLTIFTKNRFVIIPKLNLPIMYAY